MPRREARAIDLEVKAAIDALDEAALRRLRKFARRGVAQLARVGETVAPDEHEQVVHDAIADTLALVVRWNRQCTMETHLYNVILRRVSNGLRRAPKRVAVSLEALEENENAPCAPSGEPEATLGRAQVTLQLYRVARDRAEGDPEVRSMLDAYASGVTARRAVMARTGMTLAEAVNARRRLDRLLVGLPAELRFAALATIREIDN
jgi:DNA-directed RNA polymerase specialized sigma24 family protein